MAIAGCVLLYTVDKGRHLKIDLRMKKDSDILQ